MINILFGFLISLSVFASPREEAQNLLAKFQDNESVASRMDAFSKSFMEIPYDHSGPLGEGEQGR